ncbi:PA14 domain-containing protein, partial [Aquibacillus koreensis]
ISHYNYSSSFFKKVVGGKDYFVQTYADDGIRVKAGNQVLIDRWSGSAGTYNQALLTGLGSGEHVVQTDYYEHTGKAALYAEVVPFGDWYAYYYPNMNLEGTPANAKVVKAQGDGSLIEDHGNNAPISNVPKDKYSAKYVTAKKLKAGEYIVRAAADDGVKVFIDGELVLDRWSNSSFREDAVKVQIGDTNKNAQKDVHWIEVHYYDSTRNSKIDVSIEEFNLNSIINTSGWYAEYYDNRNLEGSPYVEGGQNSINEIPSLNFDWGYGAPHHSLKEYNFSARYMTDKELEAGEYIIRSNADDGIRVYIDDELVIDRWYSSGDKNNVAHINIADHTDPKVPEGKRNVHRIKVEYFEHTGKSKLNLSVLPVKEEIPNDSWLGLYYNNKNLDGYAYVEGGKNSNNKIRNLNFNWEKGSPHKNIQSDNFSASYQKQITLTSSQKYNLLVNADNAVRVYIDGQLIIDAWNSGLHSFDEIIELKKGTHNIKVEYYENTIDAYLNVDFVEIIQGKIYRTSNYDYEFDYMLDRQKLYGGPQTDLGGGGWHDPSREQLAYYVNPSNFNDKNASSYFQFMQLSRTAGLNTAEINNNILKNKGVLSNKAEIFINAGQKYGINEVYLIAHALHETGNGKSDLAIGVEYNGKKVYNMYGIGAYDKTAIESGAKYAYDKEWFTVDKAIEGGAKWIYDNYVSQGQDTLYEMKWNPNNPGIHQYATDIGWAEKQTERIEKVYDLLKNYVLIFDEPKYKNQPGKTELPINTVVSYPKGTIGKTNVDNLRFRTGPSTSYSIITELPKGKEVEIQSLNSSNNNGWFKVKIEGKEGWVAKEYVNVLNLIEITTDGLRVRSNTDTTTLDNVIGNLNTGNLVSVVTKNGQLETKGSWYQINYGNKQGWVHGDYVKVIK